MAPPVGRHITRKYQSSLRFMSTNKREFKEVSIKVPWGQVAGKWWEPYDMRPVLTLHGWQDNCGSFDRLIPLLSKDVGFLALDFPGHGYSSRIPHGMNYHFTTYVLMVVCVKNYFEWSKISLMGHSLGGITSYVYTMIYPSEVDFLVCIDGAKPFIRKDGTIHLAKQLQNFQRYNSFASDPREPPSYTIEEMKTMICAPNKNSISYEVAHYLLERNIAPSTISPGKYYFTKDPRLKTKELMNFSQDELIQFAQNMTPPIFISKAKGGSYYEIKENFYQVLDVLKRTSVDCNFHYVEGTHHAHLNNPENVADLITNFIRRHNIKDRTIGGIMDEIIVKKRQLHIAKQ